MSLLRDAVAQEQQRIERMIEGYEIKLASLPKGTIVTKSVKGNRYYYLQYRDGKKTVSEYIGKDDERVAQLQEQIEHRKHIQTMLKALREEYAAAKKCWRCPHDFVSWK